MTVLDTVFANVVQVQISHCSCCLWQLDCDVVQTEVQAQNLQLAYDRHQSRAGTCND